jgi:hypothetical protein
MTKHSILFVYQAASGQWAGRLIENGDEVAGIVGCNSKIEVEQSIREAGSHFDQVCEVDPSTLPALLDGEWSNAFAQALTTRDDNHRS